MSLPAAEKFELRHLGPSEAEVAQMLKVVGVSSLEDLLEQTVPAPIRLNRPLALPEAATERQALAELAHMASENRIFRSYLGLGYHDTVTPPVILRNVLENPGWYTAYTPYQAEISQGRREALLTYQTVVQELTGMEVANASLLDEGTAAAEAMTMAHRLGSSSSRRVFVADGVHPQTLDVVRSRAGWLGFEVVVGAEAQLLEGEDYFAALVQSPRTDGGLVDLRPLSEAVHQRGGMFICATDLLASVLVAPPGEQGADIVVGCAQRFGVPLGFGGPHAGFLATREKYARQMPGRLIGVSRDAQGQPALRMALQTREQHIRRQKATSNICTAQVLLANCAAFYAVWHGPEGLTRIAQRVHGQARVLAQALAAAGRQVGSSFFDTVKVVGVDADRVVARALQLGINLRRLSADAVVVALDETVEQRDLADLLQAFEVEADLDALLSGAAIEVDGAFQRRSAFLRQSVFHAHRSETAMLRYLHRLQVKDLALDTSMIPLGSCTMKLNATTEMIPVTWPGFGRLHPCAPLDQVPGYQRLFRDLEVWLAEITGFAATSLQPNAGSQGEYAGLLAIRRFLVAQGAAHRTVCLIPTSAHGTNPASAVMAGMEVVPVDCDAAGNIDVDDLKAKAAKHADRLAALMVTYPSTHGVFEESIAEVCSIVHHYGGQVYLDGANMNALVGLCRPGDFGADVCHLNLHKTFCIPHGGGGPGMGPICVASHLAPFLPTDPMAHQGASVSAARWGSASILPISWAYIRMLGAPGLRQASALAILNANYIAARLGEHYPVLYRGPSGRVAHECILDARGFKAAGVTVDDIAKRLMDYGFHAPTMSWPVAGTLMVEPTESENLGELDRFCDAMIGIRDEIRAVERGEIGVEASPLRGAPHTLAVVAADQWDRAYSRSQAGFPAAWTRQHKYWPTVSRIDNAYGDRQLICSCDAWPDSA